jgi:hypothetical protein
MQLLHGLCCFDFVSDIPLLQYFGVVDIDKRVWIALFWLSSYVTSHHLAVAPQSGAKDQFYCTAYYIT